MSAEPRYSRLAWKLAQRARIDGPQGGQIRAAITVAGVLLQGWGPTTTEAMRKLAEHIDEWGEQR